MNNLELALEIEIDLSSIGSRKDCRIDFLNSKASSKNNIPLWARDTSPGKGLGPPPIIPSLLAVWWGFLKGLCFIIFLSINFPDIDHILFVSISSLFVSGGRIDWAHLILSVFPLPGGPNSMMLCPPAIAISIALFALCCPFMFLKS